MNIQKEHEMRDIWLSWDYHIRERLEELDRIARKMYSEMGVFGIPHGKCREYVHEKMRELMADVVEQGHREAIKEQNQIRNAKCVAN